MSITCNYSNGTPYETQYNQRRNYTHKRKILKFMKHYLSLGAGVQSSTMALMAACSDLTPMPDAAIFADTMAEPKSVYDWLDWLEKELPFPVIRVSNGSLTDAVLGIRETSDGRRYSIADVPLFTINEDGNHGKINNRGCTIDYKIRPIAREIKKLIGHKKGCRLPTEPVVTQWIGISLDEVTRMKPFREKWAVNIWPLVEKGMSRHDCKRWMEKAGYPEPPRSACVFCPYHNDAGWRSMKTDAPEDFAKAVKLEKDLQKIKAETDNFKSIPYLHRSCVDLDKVDFSTMEDRGQLNLFENECEGMCGV